MTTTIGRYQIEKELGRGGMGVVYRARDPVIDRVIALKTIRNSDGLSAALYGELKERFLREARAAGRLQHPHIVAVLDAGTDDASGISFMAMEFVEGNDLAKELREGRRFTAEEAAALVADTADALDLAHRNGIVHRDIKPANLLLDPRGRVRITDFGIASIAESGLTKTGQVLGSPAYMSPEQITGNAIDGRSDIFSLGVVFYQLLTGERPFLGEGMSTLAYQIVHTDPIGARKLNPSLSITYEQVLVRALAKAPAERYASAGDMANDLRGGTVITSVPEPTGGGPTGTVIGETAMPLALPTPLARAADRAAPTPSVAPAGRPWLPIGIAVVFAIALVVVVAGRDPASPTSTTRTAEPIAVATPEPTPLPKAFLLIDFDHHMMDGNVTVLFDDLEVWSSPLRAVKQTKLKVPFGGPELKLAKEVLEKVVEVPAGSFRVTVKVASRGSKVNDVELTSLSLDPGATGYLRIRVGRSGGKIELKTTR